MSKSNLVLGFIGLGQMGMPLVIRLSEANYQVLVFDTRLEELSNDAALQKMQACKSVGDVVRQADIIFTCLPHENAIRSVYLGSGGILETANPGLVTCDISTAPPDLVKEIYTQMASKGAHHFDSPIFGAQKDVVAGQAYIIFSGSPDIASKVEPYFSVMAREFKYVGESGSASLMKILQNSLGYGYAIVAAEILTLCEYLGADALQFARLVKEVKVMGWSKYFDLYAEDIVTGQESETGLLHIAAKDTHLLKTILDQNNFNAPVMEEAARLFKEASELGMGQEEFTVVTKLVERNKLKSKS